MGQSNWLIAAAPKLINLFIYKFKKKKKKKKPD
jgi:hypothetical protein